MLPSRRSRISTKRTPQSSCSTRDRLWVVVYPSQRWVMVSCVPGTARRSSATSSSMRDIQSAGEQPFGTSAVRCAQSASFISKRPPCHETETTEVGRSPPVNKIFIEFNRLHKMEGAPFDMTCTTCCGLRTPGPHRCEAGRTHAGRAPGPSGGRPGTHPGPGRGRAGPPRPAPAPESALRRRRRARSDSRGRSTPASQDRRVESPGRCAARHGRLRERVPSSPPGSRSASRPPAPRAPRAPHRVGRR